MKPLPPQVQQLCDEGLFESPGQFSLDLQQARLKLARWQMSGPSDWMLKAIQGGVAAGAREINIRVERRCYHLEWTGVDAPNEWAQQWLEMLLRPTTSSYPLHALSLAFRGAPGEVSLRLGESIFQWRREELEHLPGQPGPVLLTCWPEEPLSRGSWLLRNILGTATVVTPALMKPATYCPRPILVNRQRLKTRRTDPWIEVRLMAQDPSESDILSIPPTKPALRFQERPLSSRECKLLGHAKKPPGEKLGGPALLLSFSRQPKKPGLIHWVRNGIILRYNVELIDFPGADVVLTAPRLGLDLSEFKATQGPDLRRIIDWLQALLSQILRENCDLLRAQPRPIQALWHEAYPWLGLLPRETPARTNPTALASPTVHPEEQQTHESHLRRMRAEGRRRPR